MPHRWFVESMDGSKHPSWAARMIDEIGNRSLSHAWFRFYCMDEQFREFEQPYRTTPEGQLDVVIHGGRCLN